MLTTLVSPRHYVANGILALAQALQDLDELMLKELHQIFVAAVAHQRRLVADRLEINLLPRPPHLHKLFLVREYRVQRLRDLVNVKEAHCNGQVSAEYAVR